jgi:hypothetical protein
MMLLSLDSRVVDLSLLEARGLRSGALAGVRRAVDPCPIEVRPCLWSWLGADVQGTMALDDMRASVLAHARWSPGALLFVREPWRQVASDGAARVQYRADGEVAERASRARRLVVNDPPLDSAEEWCPASDLPEWAWRMKARVLGVQVSIVATEPVGALWSLEYELKVMRHG